MAIPIAAPVIIGADHQAGRDDHRAGAHVRPATATRPAMTPLKPIPPGRKAALGIAFFVLFVAAWGAATLGGFVSKTFLADPVTMLREGWALFAKYGFAGDIAM